MPTPPPMIFFRLEGMVGWRVMGPWPERETSKVQMRLSEPVRKWVPSGVKMVECGVM
jgi:hypothetical protein